MRTMTAELWRFNEGTTRSAASLHMAVPTTAVFGEADTTALAEWHEPWLRRHVRDLRVLRLPEAGHAVHHAEPAAALLAITGQAGTR